MRQSTRVLVTNILTQLPQFRDLGHEIDTVQSERLTGASDPTILERGQAENQFLLTMDKGIPDVRRSALAVSGLR
jgi:hypothetical protein